MQDNYSKLDRPEEIAYRGENGEIEMSERTEASLSALAALFVIFVALLDPRVSAMLAVIFLISLSIYKFYFADRKRV